jgi:hypothetical protein
MEKVYICTCNNCNEEFIDTNPGPDSVQYFIPTENVFGMKELEPIEDMKACPICKTDQYLKDNKKDSHGN